MMLCPVAERWKSIYKEKSCVKRPFNVRRRAKRALTVCFSRVFYVTVCLFLSFFLQGAFFLTQSIKVLYVAVYQLWWSEGYQDFADVESGVTTKVDLPFT